MLFFKPAYHSGVGRLKRIIRYYIDRHAKKTFKKLNSKLRRFVLCTFNRRYVEKKQNSRYGDCFQCGKCCTLLYKCPFLEGPEGNTRCIIYHKGRPKQCQAFPIDSKDLHDVEFLCGYYFSDEIVSVASSTVKERV